MLISTSYRGDKVKYQWLLRPGEEMTSEDLLNAPLSRTLMVITR